MLRRADEDEHGYAEARSPSSTVPLPEFRSEAAMQQRLPPQLLAARALAKARATRLQVASRRCRPMRGVACAAMIWVPRRALPPAGATCSDAQRLLRAPQAVLAASAVDRLPEAAARGTVAAAVNRAETLRSQFLAAPPAPGAAGAPPLDRLAAFCDAHGLGAAAVQAAAAAPSNGAGRAAPAARAAPALARAALYLWVWFDGRCAQLADQARPQPRCLRRGPCRFGRCCPAGVRVRRGACSRRGAAEWRARLGAPAR